jgi:hypothetical protein
VIVVVVSDPNYAPTLYHRVDETGGSPRAGCGARSKKPLLTRPKLLDREEAERFAQACTRCFPVGFDFSEGA